MVIPVQWGRDSMAKKTVEEEIRKIEQTGGAGR
jgi:hypothetical protein